MADIDQILNEIQNLNALDGQAFIDEAVRQGFVVTQNGIYADPNHPAREYLTTDENRALIEALFARHGEQVNLDTAPETHDA